MEAIVGSIVLGNQPRAATHICDLCAIKAEASKNAEEMRERWVYADAKTTPDGTRANLFQRIEAVPLDTERKYTFKDDDVAKAEKALAAVVAGRQAALSDPHAAQDDGGNAYSDMMEDGEWSDKTDAERRAIINEDYDRFENDAREEVRKEKEARDYLAAREKTGAQLNRADHQLTILLAGLDGVEVKRQHSGQGSDYIYVSDEAGDNSVTLRVSNHRQVQGGGFRVNDMGDGRAGNADVDIVGDEVGTSIFIREVKSWSYNEKPATWQELAEYLSDNLGDVKLRDDIRFARAQAPGATPAQKSEPVVMRAFRSMKDMFALTMLPNAERAVVQDGMVHHAVAPEAAEQSECCLRLGGRQAHAIDHGPAVAL